MISVPAANETQNRHSALEREISTFEKKKSELIASAEGKFVLIHGEDLMGIYSTEVEAISEGYKKAGNVPFLVRQILVNEHPERFGGGIDGL